MIFGEFNQAFDKGERAILKSELSGGPAIVTIDGMSTKDRERIYTFGSTWARPEDFKKVDQDLLALLDDAYEGLQEYHPEQLTEDARAAIYLSVLADERSNGATGQFQYETIRDLVEAEAERIQAEQNAKPGV